MAEIKVIMPQMGESVFEGTITRWLKQVGETVARDEPLFEISTDKIDSEIPSPAAGTLKEILVGEDQTVEINTIVGLIESGDGGGSKGSESDATGDNPSGDSGVETPADNAESAPGPPPDANRDRDEIRSSPLVRRLAREHGLSLTDLEGRGTGAGGRVTKRDIMSFIEQSGEERQPDTAPAGGGEDARIPMNAMRKAIAEHMIESRRTSAHVATVFETDCSSIISARAALKPEFEKAGIKLTYTPFFVAAVAQSLRKFPILNASIDGSDIIHHSGVHIGVAVALDDGLLVPVVRDADKTSLRDLARSIADLGGRARTRKLRPEEVQGGTFTVTNPGIFGGLYGIPIINQPQVAILALGGIEKRPVVVGDAISIRPMAYMALSFDHRLIDGAVADQFMSDLKQRIQNWKA